MFMYRCRSGVYCVQYLHFFIFVVPEQESLHINFLQEFYNYYNFYNLPNSKGFLLIILSEMFRGLTVIFYYSPTFTFNNIAMI
jgi:hypothetical protein